MMQVTGMLIGRDSFAKYLQEELTGNVTVVSFTEPQQKLQRNALNLRFLDDSQQMPGMWECSASLDLLVDNERNLMTAERTALDWQEKVLYLLKSGALKKLWKNATWDQTGYIAWQALSGLRFKDVPADSYIHKNMTLKITYFVN